MTKVTIDYSGTRKQITYDIIRYVGGKEEHQLRLGKRVFTGTSEKEVSDKLRLALGDGRNWNRR